MAGCGSNSPVYFAYGWKSSRSSFATFLPQLITCFVSRSCATMFSEKDDSLRDVMGAHAELEQRIALMGTAQNELAAKL